MRNLLAFLAAAILTFAGVGWYLDWYRIKSTPAPSGHHQLNIDVNRNKIIEDVHKGVQKGEEKLQDLFDGETPPDPPKPASPTPPNADKPKQD
jgi:hypothetical protein